MKFAAWFDAQKLKDHEAEIRAIESTIADQGSSSPTSQLHSRKGMLAKRAAQYAKTAKSIRLHGLQVVAPDGSPQILRDHSDIVSGLASHWGPVFQAKPVNMECVQSYVTNHVLPCDFSHVSLTTVDMFFAVL